MPIDSKGNVYDLRGQKYSQAKPKQSQNSRLLSPSREGGTLVAVGIAVSLVLLLIQLVKLSDQTAPQGVAEARIAEALRDGRTEDERVADDIEDSVQNLEDQLLLWEQAQNQRDQADPLNEEQSEQFLRVDQRHAQNWMKSQRLVALSKIVLQEQLKKKRLTAEDRDRYQRLQTRLGVLQRRARNLEGERNLSPTELQRQAIVTVTCIGLAVSPCSAMNGMISQVVIQSRSGVGTKAPRK